MSSADKERAKSDKNGKWSPRSEFLLEARYGVDPTPVLARILGKSLTAVRLKASREGILFHDNDGRLTIAELSRQTGYSTTWLSRKLASGNIDGIGSHAIVNGFHRIEWDGETPIRPKWRSTTIRKDVQGKSPKGEKAACCINCTSTIDTRGAESFCSVGCSGEYRVMLVDELRRDGESPIRTFPSHLRPPFQDWLVRIGLMGRTGRVDLPIKPGAKVPFKQQQIRDLLQAYPGYIVPDELINLTLYPDLRGEDHNKLRYQVYQLRQSLTHKADVFVAMNLGLAVGVQSSSLSLRELRFLRILYQKSGMPAKGGYLARNLYPQDFEQATELCVERVVDIASDVKGKLKGSGFDVVEKGRGKIGSNTYSLRAIR